MSKITLTVFVCTGKDCRKAWDRVCDGSPSKWLKRQLQDAELPYKLDVIKTDCMDRCKHAANVCFMHNGCAGSECDIHSHHDTDRLLAALRACVERSAYPVLNTACKSDE
jgi:predicted metal-binding protein